MSIYSNVESGTKMYKSRFHKSISYSKNYDCNFGQLIPVLEKFVMPGDVWRIGGNALIRFLPMTSPSMTANKFKVRYFFVPLRLLDKNTEFIITGSQDGSYDKNETVPTFPNMFDNADKTLYPNCYKVVKHSLLDYFGIPVGDYESIKNDECLPAEYWKPAYFRILWDYYLDENLSYPHYHFKDFNKYYEDVIQKVGGDINPGYAMLPKDYFTSALPWQLKGPTPVLDVTGTWNPQFQTEFFYTGSIPENSQLTVRGYDTSSQTTVTPFNLTGFQESASSEYKQSVQEAYNDEFNRQLNQAQSFPAGIGFNGDELRTMMAQTRIFERLARTGSRYTEYLHANFGTAPVDGTLQRAQYLGGWSMPIVTTEVLQTAEDGSTPVGTMRGHGISNGGNRIGTFFAHEFGVIIGIAHVLPKIQYTQGISRELTYKRRFDFFNPSLQHLSEQEVRNGELFISFSDGKNDDTLGFQAYANELRSSTDKVVGDMRDGLKYWNQAIHFSNRPNLNQAFLNSSSYSDNFNQTFVQVQNNPCNIIVDFYNDLDVYRPMVRYSTPGLVDHL